MTKPLPDVLRLSAVEMAAALAKRDLSARELVSASLDWITAQNERLNAFITVAAEQALEQAARADERAAQGERLPPLHGLPIGIKDLTATAGIRTTFGSSVYRDHVPERDELVVERLWRAGAIIVGKTNTPEFGFGARCLNLLCGPTANPYDPSRTSGGSSGGSAVAVASGMTALAHGTDYGGSVRTPASFCGVVGLRPTPGVIPNSPKLAFSDSWNVHGVLARSVEDAALMLEAAAGGDREDVNSAGRPPWSSRSLAGALDVPPRLAYAAGLGTAKIDPEVLAVFERAIAAMEPLVRSAQEAAPDCTGAQEAFETLRAANLFYSLGDYCAAHGDKVSQTVRWNVERGRDITAMQYLQADQLRRRVYLEFVRFFESYDLLATVSASVPPFPNSQSDVRAIGGVPTRNIIDYLTVTYVISVVGFPALSIPCGWTSEGLPVGLQLVAPPFEETKLLAFAKRLEDEVGFKHRWP